MSTYKPILVRLFELGSWNFRVHRPHQPHSQNPRWLLQTSTEKVVENTVYQHFCLISVLFISLTHSIVQRLSVDIDMMLQCLYEQNTVECLVIKWYC